MLDLSLLSDLNAVAFFLSVIPVIPLSMWLFGILDHEGE